MLRRCKERLGLTTRDFNRKSSFRHSHYPLRQPHTYYCHRVRLWPRTSIDPGHLLRRAILFNYHRICLAFDDIAEHVRITIFNPNLFHSLQRQPNSRSQLSSTPAEPANNNLHRVGRDCFHHNLRFRMVRSHTPKAETPGSMAGGDTSQPLRKDHSASRVAYRYSARHCSGNCDGVGGSAPI